MLQASPFYTRSRWNLLTSKFINTHNWSQMFALLYVRCVAISNWKLWTTKKNDSIALESRETSCVLNHVFALHSNTCCFAWSLKNIFPDCFNIVIFDVLQNIFKKIQNKRESNLVFRQHPACHVAFPEWLHSLQPMKTFLFVSGFMIVKLNLSSLVFEWIVYSMPWYNFTGWLGVKHQFTYLLQHVVVYCPNITTLVDWA